jgi:uncharacterized protein (DUF2267 family)
MSHTGHPSFDATIDTTDSPPVTASTARYRCSTTDNSTSANPGLPPRAVRKRHTTGKPITATVNHQVGPKCQASTGTRQEFLQRIRKEFPYAVEGGIEPLIRTVLQALRRHVTDGEWGHIKSSVPRELASVLP